MFERFTDKARRVVVLAQEEARLFDHDYIGTEHILLGLIHEREGVSAKALEFISLDVVRSEVEKHMEPGESSPRGHIPFAPGSSNALKLASTEADALGHDEIGPEHILLGLISEAEGIAGQVLVQLGVEPVEMRRYVGELCAFFDAEGLR